MTANSSTFLAVDLGSTCGFAVGSYGHMLSGAFPNKTWEGRLDELYNVAPVDRVYCVNGGVKQRSRMQRLAAMAEQWGVELEVVKRSTIGRSFAGKGNASGHELISECTGRGFEPQSEEEAGAIALFDLALRHH